MRNIEPSKGCEGVRRVSLQEPLGKNIGERISHYDNAGTVPMSRLRREGYFAITLPMKAEMKG